MWERKERREAYRRGDPSEGRASCQVAAAEGRTARPPPPTRLRAKAEESGGALVDGVAWGKCHATGRPYRPIGSTGVSSKWTVSHLRLTRWPIGLAIVGRASDPMVRSGPFSS